jgi:hypothetical protein
MSPAGGETPCLLPRRLTCQSQYNLAAMSAHNIEIHDPALEARIQRQIHATGAARGPTRLHPALRPLPGIMSATMLTDDDKQWMLEQREREREWILEQRGREREWILEQREREREWTLAQLERVETKLLTEFHKCASPIEMRVRSHSAALRAIDIEVEAVSDRVTKLEGTA